MKKNKKVSIKEIEDTIKAGKRLPKEVQNEINSKVFKNILLAIVVMLYFYFINLGCFNIKPDSYILDLKVFTVSLIVTAIVVFEIAYKHDSGEIAILGIETAILGLITLTTIYTFAIIPYKYIYIYIYTIIAYLFATYYVSKALIIYKKMNKAYLLEEMKKITKKDK